LALRTVLRLATERDLDLRARRRLAATAERLAFVDRRTFRFEAARLRCEDLVTRRELRLRDATRRAFRAFERAAARARRVAARRLARRRRFAASARLAFAFEAASAFAGAAIASAAGSCADHINAPERTTSAARTSRRARPPTACGLRRSSFISELPSPPTPAAPATNTRGYAARC